MRLVVGVDAGGTKTLARAWALAPDASPSARALTSGHAHAEEAACVAEVEADGIDLPVIGAEQSLRRLLALRAAIEERLPPGAEVQATVLGLPGLGEVPAWTEGWRGVVQDAFADWAPSLHNDVRLAFYAAFPDGHGILMLAGTGSMAWGGDGRGPEARCGGWGPWFGDEGSAHEVGRKALKAAAAALDGRGEATRMGKAIPQALGVSDLWAVLGRLVEDPHASRAQVAGLAKVVNRLAEEGDAVALRCLHEAGEALAKHVLALRRRWPQEALPVAYAGGAFRSAALRERFQARLMVGGSLPARAAEVQPVAGALALARRGPARAGNEEHHAMEEGTR